MTEEETFLDPITALDIPPPLDNTFMDRISAGIAIQDPIPLEWKTYPPVEDYDVFSDPAIENYDPMLFYKSRSPEETQSIIRNVEYYRDLQRRSQGFAGTIGEIMGAIANPILAIPAMLTGGASLPAAIAVEAGAEVVNETILHSNQPERTMAESAINIGTAGLFTLGAGVAAGRFSARAQTKAAEKIKKLEPPGLKPTEGVGAATVIPPKLYQETISVPHPNLVRGLGGTLISPAADVVTNSASNVAKQAARDLVDVPIRVEGPATTSVESAIKKAEGDVAKMEFFARDKYKLYKENGGDLDRNGFDELVSDAMRNGDTHYNKQVQAVARHKRKYDQGYFDTANSLGMYGDSPPPLKGSRSHLQRIYNRKAVLEGRPHLKRLILSKLGRGELFVVRLDDPDLDVVFGLVEPKDWPGLKMQHGENIRMAVGADTDMVADNIIDNILGKPGQFDFAGFEHAVPKAGSLHERTLGFLSDNELRPYLENNSTTVMGITARQMTRSIEMTRKFGDIRMKEVIKQIREDYRRLMNEAKTAKERVKLGNRMKKDISLIHGLRDNVLGTYGRPNDAASRLVTGGRLLRMGALLSQGLNIPLSSVSDIVAPALRHGFKPFYHGMRVLASGQSTAYKRYVQHLGIAVESVTNSRALEMADTAFAKKWERTAHRAFGKYTGLNLFTDITQSLNAVSTSSMWIGWMKNWGKVSTGNKAKLLDMGIDDDLAGRINSQITAHGMKRNGVTLPESHLWDDAGAARAFENALRKEVHTTTLVPGKGDLPLWMRTETGRFIGMFQTFITSAHTKFLIAGLQRHDADFMTGLLITTVAGMMTAGTKEAIRGRDISDKEMHQWVMDGIDRAGILAWLAPPANQARRLFTEDMPSRYAARRGLTQFIEPAPMGYAIDVGTSAVGAAQGNTNDIWRLLRTVPFANSMHAVDIIQTTTGGRK